jgi:hypothetical protein
MSRAVLPLDVICCIIDLVEDKRLLSACSRISCAYLGPARSRLFREFSLSKITPKSLQSANILNKNPQLASYVKVVSVHGGTTEDKKLVLEGVFTAIAPLLVNEEKLLFVRFRFGEENYGPAALAALVHNFPNLQTLGLSSSPFYSEQELATVFGAHPRLRAVRIVTHHGDYEERRPLPENLETIFQARRGSTLHLDTFEWSKSRRWSNSNLEIDGLLSYHGNMKIETMVLPVHKRTILAFGTSLPESDHTLNSCV